MKIALTAALFSSAWAVAQAQNCDDPCWQYSGGDDDDCEEWNNGNDRWLEDPFGKWRKCKYSNGGKDWRQGNKCYSDGYKWGGYPCFTDAPTAAPTATPLSRSEAVAAIGGLPETPPTQTFFVPVPEEDCFNSVFEELNSVASPPVKTILSVTISTTGTKIWYDHWEDGYEADVENPTQTNTQVWGDGDASNGCAPFDYVACTDENDYLVAGDALVISNDVSIPRDSNVFRKDGGDRIQANYPIAVTRSAYPNNPGSLMAGAVEVLDLSMWGKNFRAPVGPSNDLMGTSGFELTRFFLMASEDGTTVTKPDGSTVELNMGESVSFDVDEGDTITTDKPCQADLITGDKGDNYENRWFSILDTDNWSDQYLSPVGDETGDSIILLFNPNNYQITVTVETRESTYTRSLAANSAGKTDVIPDGSGAKLTSTNNKFIALGVTDTVGAGRAQDWGFPVQPMDHLTSQVLVGLGFGCTNNFCGTGKMSRNVVWIAPSENCWMHIDFNNDGVVDKTIQLDYLESITVRDEKDEDMSGAILYATKTNDYAGTPVKFAAAWGQDPDLAQAYSNEELNLDMGTTILPFNEVKVYETVKLFDDKNGDGLINPGDILEYCIFVMNVGQVDFAAQSLTLKGPLNDLDQRTYVPGSGVYTDVDGGQGKSFSDSALGSTGLKIQYDLGKRGGTHKACFKASVDDISEITDPTLPNSGVLVERNLPFGVTSKVSFSADIDIVKTVTRGSASGSSCSIGVDSLSGYNGEEIHYCNQVTNTGGTYLKDVTVEDPLGFSYTIPGILAPDATVDVPFNTDIDGDVETYATVKGTPVLVNGDPITTLDEVFDQDPAAVAESEIPTASISIVKTVNEDHSDGATCNDGGELVKGYSNAEVHYCYFVKNTGETCLKNVKIEDPDSSTGFTHSVSGLLCPTESVRIPFNTKITGTEDELATATGTPVDSSGNSIPGLDGDVTAQDSAGVEEEEYPTPGVEIIKVVFPGHSSSETENSCSISNGAKTLVDVGGTPAHFCYQIRNTGNTCLTGIDIKDTENDGFGYAFVGKKLCPGDDPITIPKNSVIAGDKTTLATVVANPVRPDGTGYSVDLGTVTDEDDAGVDDTCPEEPTDAFSSSFYVTYSGSPNIDVNNLDVAALESNLVTGFNSLAAVICDPFLRKLDSATFDASSIIRAFNKNGLLFGFRVKVTVSGKCIDCVTGGVTAPVIDELCVAPEADPCCPGSAGFEGTSQVPSGKALLAEMNKHQTDSSYQVIRIEGSVEQESCAAGEVGYIDHSNDLVCRVMA